MAALLDQVLDAYGGRARWEQVRSISARKRFGGITWQAKQVAGILDDGQVTVEVQRERTSFTPFTAADLRVTFEPDRVAVETLQGEVKDELLSPRASFAGHTLETPWTPLQLGYFAGYAMWTYLTEPYSLTLPGVQTEEGEPWQEGDETWRRLHVTYPAYLASHSASQVVYIDDRGLLRRRDYVVDVLGGTPGIHYVSGFQEVAGIIVPTKRTILPRGEGNHALPEPVIVSIDLSGSQV